MEYRKTQINAFAGLDNNQRPELIQDPQASDIENLRFDKLGYLVNRNGVRVVPCYHQRIVYADIRGTVFPIGAFGISEFTLRKPWGIGDGEASAEAYNDDAINAVVNPALGEASGQSSKFMVYAIRLPANAEQWLGHTDWNNYPDLEGGITDPANWPYKAAYILSPVTGPDGWRDAFHFAPNARALEGVAYQPATSHSELFPILGGRHTYAADDRIAKDQLYAPQRYLGEHNIFFDGNNPKDSNWIDHYVTMNQYRDALVISDKNNGDMILVDEYNESEFAVDSSHRFTMRENTLPEFDIDDVVVDFGINTGGFNDGVESGMVLYKYYLPRRRGIPTVDHYTPHYAGTVRSPTLERDVFRGSTGTWQYSFNSRDAVNVFLSTEYIFGEEEVFSGRNQYGFSALSLNAVKRYTFSTSKDGGEIDDLFGALTLKNPDVEEDTKAATDAYVWEDLKIKYYPCGGVDQQTQFLRAKDRTWDRSTLAATKVVELTTKSGVEQDVPLGVWRYRFVWYFGNGQYSVASSELVVPDILFSGMKDDDIVSALGSYARPFGLTSEADAMRTGLELNTAPSDAFINELAAAQGVRVFDGASVTTFGESFLRIKQELLNPEHTFGALYSSTQGASWPTNWASEGLLAQGQAQVFCTVYFPDAMATCEGVAAETAESQVDEIIDDTVGGDYNGLTFIGYKATAIPLSVALFSDSNVTGPTGESVFFNSVFTDYGVPRTVYQNKAQWSAHPSYDANKPAYQLIMEGKHRFGVSHGDSNFHANGLAGGSRLVFNVVAFPGLAQDENNSDDENTYSLRKRYEYRNMTVVRGVRDDTERISWLKNTADLPAEVLDRIIVSGTGEFTLCDFGDPGGLIPQIKKFNNENDDTLLRSLPRDYIDFSDTDWFDGTTNGHTFVPLEIFRGQGIFHATNDYVGKLTNLRVVVSGRGERLTIHEQLSTYVPASILFDAPRVKLRIPADRIPRRARQLMVFRTRASHDNAWQPHLYGLVKAIDIIRDEQGAPAEEHATAIEYLDDVKSAELDYTYDLNAYEGLTRPLRSRFNIPLNERVYYANHIETYRPRHPRSSVNVLPFDEGGPDEWGLPHRNLNYGAVNTELVRLWTWKVVAGDTATVNIDPATRYLYYAITYKDAANAHSLAAVYGPIDRGATAPVIEKARVCLICAPSAYDGTVKEACIWRLEAGGPVAEISTEDGAYTALATHGKKYIVKQGVAKYHTNIYYPNEVFETAPPAATGTEFGFRNQLMNEKSPIETTWSSAVLMDMTDVMDPAQNGGFKLIGTLKPEDEGVFYDDDLEGNGVLEWGMLLPPEDELSSGLRWSEPYEPNKIKLSSLMEVRAGDGDQITGVAMLYGNLIVFKERSMHRLAVQGSEPPVSRVDEISNQIGCIAPNTILTINNVVYFLSWSGFYRYNNNILEKMDGPFAEELHLRLRSAQQNWSNPAIRDASCGWDPQYNEVRLTIPIFTTTSDEDGGSGMEIKDNIGTRTIRGATYAINIDNGFVTKYRNMDDAVHFNDVWDGAGYIYEDVDPVSPDAMDTQRAPRTHAKIYHTNSLGQLRSAEVLPPRLVNPNLAPGQPNNRLSMTFLHSAFFIESPTVDAATGNDEWRDDYLTFGPSGAVDGSFIPRVAQGARDVRTFWRSKAWTADDKSVLKRVRKVFLYMESTDQPTVIRGTTHTSPEGPHLTAGVTWEKTYGVAATPPHPVGELLAIPQDVAPSATTEPASNRGERYTFEVEAGGRVQMEYFGFYWKPINTYER